MLYYNEKSHTNTQHKLCTSNGKVEASVSGGLFGSPAILVLHERRHKGLIKSKDKRGREKHEADGASSPLVKHLGVRMAERGNREKRTRESESDKKIIT